MTAHATKDLASVARTRSGFSLLEILLALSILGGSLAVLSQIAEIGTSAAREARELSVCRMLCQSKLALHLKAFSTHHSIRSIRLPRLPTTTPSKSNQRRWMDCCRYGYRSKLLNETVSRRSLPFP